ncbi:hypothetical protein [Nonomuraea sp. NPDC050783]|uniref:hypothetical protein n=1 Tax=Nonomuraea sp. NPDC050783 TaxID=3154634 RepID=UPI0034656694
MDVLLGIFVVAGVVVTLAARLSSRKRRHDGPPPGEAELRAGEFVRVRRQVLQDMRSKPALLEGRLPSSRLFEGG